MRKLFLFRLGIARSLAGQPHYFLESDVPREGGREGGRKAGRKKVTL